MRKRRKHRTQTRTSSLRLIWLLHLPLCSQCPGTHHLWTDHQRPTAMRLILKLLLHPCLVSKPKPYRGHNWQMVHLPGLQAETLQPMTLHKMSMTFGIRHSISQLSQAKLTCNCLLGKQQMYSTADYNRTLAEHTWTQVTYHDELACVLFYEHQAASSLSACVARHPCSCAGDSTAEQSALLLHGVEQCCHLLHQHVMSQDIPAIQTLVVF